MPGYTLITVLVGYNPLLDESVPRTAINLVGGLLGLVPGGTALFDRLNESGAIQEAFDWLSAEVTKLNLSWTGIKALLEEAWDKMTLVRGFSCNLNVIKQVFGPTVTRIINFVKAIGTKVLELIFKGALKLVGAPVERFMTLLNKGKAVLGKIFSDPIQFVKNLANSIKMGLQLFLTNIKKHLLNGLIGWLTGALGDAGITLPEKFDLKGIFSLVMQILGLTYQNIRIKLVKRLGEKTVGRIEKTVEFIKLLITKGPMALWEKIKEKISDLKDAVMNGIRDWIISKVIMEGVTWVLGLLNPAGALIKIIKVLYNVVMFFIERWNQIVDFATSVFNSIGEIANGQLGQAAKYVETTIGKAVPVMISFLASLLGLGGISAKIRDIIEKIRKPIDKGVEKIIDWIVTKAKAFVEKVKKLARKAKEAVSNWWNGRKNFKDKAGNDHEVYFDNSKKLIRASANPEILTNWLTAERRRENPGAAAKIDTSLQKIQEYKTREDTGGARVDASFGRELGGKINTELGNIATQLAKFSGGALPKTRFKAGAAFSTHTVKLPEGDSVVANTMEAELLTLNPPDGYPGGSAPIGQTILYNEMNKRSGTYIQGHLLNHHVHGPGQPFNLIPITGSLNTRMEGEAENAVKREVLNNRNVVRYRVEARFADASKHMGFPNAKGLEAEKYLPSGITVEADLLTLKDGQDPNLVASYNKTTLVSQKSLLEKKPSDDPPASTGALEPAKLIAIMTAVGLQNAAFAAAIKIRVPATDINTQTIENGKRRGINKPDQVAAIQTTFPAEFLAAAGTLKADPLVTPVHVKRILDELSREGKTQKDFADALGVGPRIITDWKNRPGRQPNAEQSKQIIAYLNSNNMSYLVSELSLN